MLLGFNGSKCTAYTVDSARGLIVIRTRLVLASGKLQSCYYKKIKAGAVFDNLTSFIKGHLILDIFITMQALLQNTKCT